MKNFKYEDIKYNEHIIGKKIKLSLTSEFSHEINVELGQGSFNIGIKGVDNDYIDAWVNKDDRINWNAFDGCETIFNSKDKWPRFFSYTGNDIGFIEWSKKRQIEEFIWYPQNEMSVDFTNANIFRLSIKTDNLLNLSLGYNIDYLDLFGDPFNYIFDRCDKIPSLGFHFKVNNNLKIYQLPIIDCFKEVEELLVEVETNGAPFDCSSLLQFSNLKLLYLIGNMTNLSSLKELKHLNELGFWNVPELSDLPNLNNWEELNNLVATNIDETTGNRLKKELKDLKKSRKFGIASVTKLRNKLWFETEYGSPFLNWNSTIEKKANLIYKKCLKNIKNSLSENDIKNAIINYTNSFNKMDDIETVERNDIYKGLCILMKNSPIDIEHDTWLNWFNEIRNF